MFQTEARELVHRNAVLLIQPREFQPELPLCAVCGRSAACAQQLECAVTVPGQLLHVRLERPELYESAAGQASHDRHGRGSGRAPAQHIELLGGAIELRDHLAIMAPRVADLLRFTRIGSIELASCRLVFALEPAVLALESIQAIPKVRVELIGPFVRCVHRGLSLSMCYST